MNNKKLNVLLALLIVALMVSLVWLVFTGGVSEIHAAAAQGDLVRVKSILAKKPELVNARDKDGWTPLHMAANAGNKEIAELLFAKGAEVNSKTNVGHTPLHMASIDGQKSTIELLLAKGAEVNAITDDGHTPLKYSIVMEHDDVADLLRKHGGVE